MMSKSPFPGLVDAPMDQLEKPRTPLFFHELLQETRRKEDARWPRQPQEEVHSPESTRPPFPIRPPPPGPAINGTEQVSTIGSPTIAVGVWGLDGSPGDDSLHSGSIPNTLYWEDETDPMPYFPASFDQLLNQSLLQDPVVVET